MNLKKIIALIALVAISFSVNVPKVYSQDIYTDQLDVMPNENEKTEADKKLEEESNMEIYDLESRSSKRYHIIINTKTNKLAYFKDNKIVKEFSVATGKKGTETPTGKTTIVNKIKNRPYYADNIPGGDPSNPLGDRWLGLNLEGAYGTVYAIHGNNNPSSIGKHVSGGCIRMHNEEVRWLFDQVPVGTTVILANTSKSYSEIASDYKIALDDSYTVKTLTTDIYRYDAGAGNHLTFINGRGYSQYSYLNKSGNYAFTPSSWMKAAGLEVTMPTTSNGYQMHINNPYIQKSQLANELLEKVEAGEVTSRQISSELDKLNQVSQANDISSKYSVNSALTTDIYKYDAGAGNHLTFINGRGYSQYSYLNRSGNYAFTPSSWMKAAGLEVTMPTKANGYRMDINNQYMSQTNNVINQIEEYK